MLARLGEQSEVVDRLLDEIEHARGDRVERGAHLGQVAGKALGCCAHVDHQFFNRFAGMARLSPILPITSANTKFQPVSGEDVAQAAVKGVLGQAAPGVYELGGPDVATFRELMQGMLKVIARRRLILALPRFVARIMAFGFDAVQAVTLGLNYPNGPFKFADVLGVQNIHRILDTMNKIYADPRYRPNIWLTRRAQLGVSALTEET